MTDTAPALIHADSLPAIPGLIFRHFTFADIPAMADVFNACGRADGNNWFITAEQLHQQYSHLGHSDVEQDILVAAIGQQLIGYGRIQWSDQSDGLRNYFHFMHVLPQWRGQGIELAALSFFEQRAQTINAEQPSANKPVLSTICDGVKVELQQFLVAQGYRPIRYGYDMVRDLGQPIAELPLPPGIEVRPAKPEHYRQIWEADVEAFRDHWGFHEPNEADYTQWLNGGLFQPELWQIAWQGDQVVGMIQNFINHAENAEFKRQRGYTEGISVRRAWRRQGIASALLHRSMRMHKELGMTEAALGVDAQNPNGALSVYQQAGFVVERETLTYRKDLI